MDEVEVSRVAPEQRRRMVLLCLSAFAAAVSFMRPWVLTGYSSIVQVTVSSGGSAFCSREWSGSPNPFPRAHRPAPSPQSARPRRRPSRPNST